MPIRDSVTLNEVVDLLNSMLELDKETTQRLVETRIVCNQKLADHPTIQVSSYRVEGQHHVGLLGVLNGLFGVDEDLYGGLAVVYEVICPNGHKTKNTDTIMVNCHVCGSKLMLGSIEKFVNRGLRETNP